MSVAFLVTSFVVFAVYGLVAAAARERVLRSHRVLPGSAGPFAACFLVLSGRLALESR